MVFSSIPVYLDPPNWQQQPNHQHHPAHGSESTHLLPPLPPQTVQVGIGAGSIRPGSMADRARLAKIPPPEAALKCPRCESTNTKFCYFNNYSLSQPRHFCKTCRRYWTRGGALRNVPVGGGCRRNKKNKRSRSKSPADTDKQATSAIPSPSSGGTRTTELIAQLPQPSNLPFMAPSLQNLTRYGVGNMTLNLPQTQSTDHTGFQMGNNSGAGSTILSGGGVDHWRLQQFPFLNNFVSSAGAGSYPFQSGSVEEGASSLVGVGDDSLASSRVTTQLPAIKLEDNRGLNLSRSPLSISENNQFYSWTDLSGLASSSTGHLL
ncbi:hypothetical protein L6164_021868 [Bauhinia variegata]|uniref:Uncharacterized protein n=1 Tax=Bauhinia variegata TaxID=167791 RepID=A0ACB9MDT3_BAUVA|nr:hypothetical protein L6164_021868 [Bauhinia variegata]